MQALYKFELDELFLGRIKKFMIGYGLFFTIFVAISLVVAGPPINTGLYMVFLCSITATTLLVFMPLTCLKMALFYSIPAYIVFDHLFLYNINGIAGPYISLYFIPITLSSLLFNYAGPVVSILITMASCLLLDPLPILPEFVLKYLPFMTISVLLAIMGVFISTTLREDRENLADLFRKVLRGKKEWEASLDAIDDMITIHDVTGRITRINMAVSRRLKKGILEILGKDFDEVFYGFSSQSLKFCESANEMSMTYEKRCGEFLFEVTSYPLHDENGQKTGHVSYLKDITARKKYEDALKRELQITKMFFQTDQVILSTTDNLEILRACVGYLNELIDADYVAIATYDGDENVFRIEASAFHGVLERGVKIIPFETTCLKGSICKSQFKYLLKREEFLGGDVDFKNKRICNLLALPIIAKGEPLGALIVGRARNELFPPEDVELMHKYAMQIALAMDNNSVNNRLQGLFMSTVASLSSAIDAKSSWTRHHSERVAGYTRSISENMGLDESFKNDLNLAVLLHDIGKICVNDAILNKPHPLSYEEAQIVEQHAAKGAAILTPINELKNIIPIVRHHHERWDGTGYPDRLSGNMIPLGARIISVADAFDAMISDRPYRKGLPEDEAVNELMRCSFSQFDPKVVEAFILSLNRQL